MPTAAAATVDDIQLGTNAFWLRPLDERDQAFAALRQHCPIGFHPELEEQGASPVGPGFWSLTRYDDVRTVNRRAGVSGGGDGRVRLRRELRPAAAAGDLHHPRRRRSRLRQRDDAQRHQLGDGAAHRPPGSAGRGAGRPRTDAERDRGDRPLGRDLRTTSEPDRLLSPFINGIERMRCEFSPANVDVDVDLDT